MGAGAAINSTTTNRWGFLKFPQTTLSGTISKGYLRLRYFYRDGGTNAYVVANGIKLSKTTDTTWTETGITGTNYPSFGDADSLSVTEGIAGSTYSTGASANNIA